MYQHDNQSGLAASDRAASSAITVPVDTINPYKQDSLAFNVEQHLGDRLTFTADGLLSWKRDASSSVYGTDSDSFYATYVKSHAQNVHGGLAYNIASDWTLEIGGTHSRVASDLAYSSNPFGYINDQYTDFFKSEVNSIDANASGTIARLWARPVKLAVGGTWRRESASEIATDPAFAGVQK